MEEDSRSPERGGGQQTFFVSDSGPVCPESGLRHVSGIKAMPGRARVMEPGVMSSGIAGK